MFVGIKSINGGSHFVNLAHLVSANEYAGQVDLKFLGDVDIAVDVGQWQLLKRKIEAEQRKR